MTSKVTIILGAVAGVALSMASTTSFALGEADGQWFKVRYKTTNVRQIDHDTGTMRGGSSSGTCYIGLAYVADDTNPMVDPGGYEGVVVCPNSSGDWVETNTFTLTELPGGDSALGHDALVSIDDVRVTFINPSDHLVSGFGDHLLTVRTDRDGNFKSGKFQTLAGVLDTDSTFDGGATSVAGGYVVRGSSIPVSKLPFLP